MLTMTETNNGVKIHNGTHTFSFPSTTVAEMEDWSRFSFCGCSSDEDGAIVFDPNMDEIERAIEVFRGYITCVDGDKYSPYYNVFFTGECVLWEGVNITNSRHIRDIVPDYRGLDRESIIEEIKEYLGDL